jgi:GalNAc-alpha-(1->4)-GalNAc-alpha-(1->3)-diNAcBac-PP-undecaprenol alpha-1,4-N-acetyl-D-galactosaminyltransferase
LNKIALLIDSLGTGGAQRQLVNLAIGLRKRGLHPVIIIYTNVNYFDDLLKREEITVHYLKRRHFADLIFFSQLVRLFWKEDVSKVIAFLFVPSGYALLSKLFLPSLHVIVSERSFEGKTTLKDKIFPRKLYWLTNYITANSRSQTICLENLFERYKSRIVYIPNGVYDSEYLYDPPSEKIVIASIGRVSELKRTKSLINAVCSLKASFPHIEFKVYWIGAAFDATNHDTSYYDECCKLLEDRGLNSIWKWTGQIKNVKELLSDCSILVHVSRGEGFPNAICEAMSYGIPVIASNVMDHPYIVQHRLNGFLVDIDNSNDLEIALSDFVVMSIEERVKMSKAAFDTAIQSFSLDNMTSAYLELLQNDK